MRKIQHAIGKQAIPPVAKFTSVKLLEEKINTDTKTGARKPKNSRLALSQGKNGIEVKREKQDLTATTVEFGGREYIRTYQFGNRSSEALVRKNLALLIAGVRHAVATGLDDGKISADKKLGLKSTIYDVEGICASDDGISSRDFINTKGKHLEREKAFRYMIRQFFKDEPFALAVCKTAVFDYYTGGI